MAYILCTECSPGRGPIIVSVWFLHDRGAVWYLRFSWLCFIQHLTHSHTCALGTPLSMHHTFICVQCLCTWIFVLCHPGIYESGHHASQEEGQQPAWPRARCPPEYFVLWRDRPYVHGNRCYWQEGQEPGKEKGLVITVCLSVCLSALGQECLCKKCGQMIVSNLIIRISGYYQMLFVQIFGKGKYNA